MDQQKKNHNQNYDYINLVETNDNFMFIHKKKFSMKRKFLILFLSIDKSLL